MKSQAKNFIEDFKLRFFFLSDEDYDSVFYRTLAAWYRKSADGKLIQNLIIDTPVEEIAALLGVSKYFIGTEVYKAVHGRI